MTEYTTPEEDEAFNEMERQAQQRKEAVKAQVNNPYRDQVVEEIALAMEAWGKKLGHMPISAPAERVLASEAEWVRGMKKSNSPVPHNIDAYAAGWNAALEMASHKIEYNFITAFGKDTLQSIAIYIRGMKK